MSFSFTRANSVKNWRMADDQKSTHATLGEHKETQEMIESNRRISFAELQVRSSGIESLSTLETRLLINLMHPF